MKALTICQPFAELILLPATDPRHKRVENRTWATHYRGMFYVHAGKSREWLDEENDAHPSTINYGIPISRMAFGAIVGTARLVDCVRIGSTGAGERLRLAEGRRSQVSVAAHAPHAEGPYGWILDEVTAIGPWPWRGAQGLFDVDERELDRVANRTLELQQV
jgi:hypothetical protein